MPRKSSAEEIVDRLIRFDKQVNFRTTSKQHAALKQYAEENGVGEGEALRYAIKLLTEEEA